MGLFSFLFKDHRRSQNYDYEEEEWEKTSLLQPFSSPDPSEDVSDATMMIPRVHKRTISPDAPASKEKVSTPEPETPSPADEVDDEMDDLMNAISSAVQRKTAKPSRPMSGTQSMLSNVASLVDDRESQLEEDATAVLARADAAADDATVVVKQPEHIVTTDTMGDFTRAVFPSKSEISEPTAAAEANAFEATAILTKEPEAEAPEEVAVEEPITISGQPEQAEESKEDTYTEEVPVPQIVEAAAAPAENTAIETEDPTAPEMTESVDAEPIAEAVLIEESEPTADAIVEDAIEEEVVPAEEDTFETSVEKEAAPAEESAVTEESVKEIAAEEKEPEAPQANALTVEDYSIAETEHEPVPPSAPQAEDSLFAAEHLTPNPLVSQVLSSVATKPTPAETAPTEGAPLEASALVGTALAEHDAETKPIAPVLSPAQVLNADEDEEDEPAWGAHWVSPDASIPSASDEYFRLTWKLKGTGKKRRLRAISECVKGQPVYITCGPDDSECMVITEDGEEIGHLTDQDSMVYHTLVSGHPHNMYIKKIRSSQFEKTKVKILVIVHRGSSNAAENGIISDS